jgi:hypothetical protein
VVQKKLLLCKSGPQAHYRQLKLDCWGWGKNNKNSQLIFRTGYFSHIKMKLLGIKNCDDEITHFAVHDLRLLFNKF